MEKLRIPIPLYFQGKNSNQFFFNYLNDAILLNDHQLGLGYFSGRLFPKTNQHTLLYIVCGDVIVLFSVEKRVAHNTFSYELSVVFSLLLLMI